LPQQKPLSQSRLETKYQSGNGYANRHRYRQYPVIAEHSSKGFTLAQKMVGKACGVAGVRPNTYCEPHMTTVGSQDTTGPMTRDELKDLACLGFSADLVMQSFCQPGMNNTVSWT
jgi:aconitase B